MEQGLWLEIPISGLTMQDLGYLNGRRVAIEGRVNSNNRGHRGAYVAALEDVNYIADSQMSEPIKLTDTSEYPEAYVEAFIAVKELVEATSFDPDELNLSYLCVRNICEFAVYSAKLEQEGFSVRGCPAEYYCADLRYDTVDRRITDVVHWR